MRPRQIRALLRITPHSRALRQWARLLFLTRPMQVAWARMRMPHRATYDSFARRKQHTEADLSRSVGQQRERERERDLSRSVGPQRYPRRETGTARLFGHPSPPQLLCAAGPLAKDGVSWCTRNSPGDEEKRRRGKAEKRRSARIGEGLASKKKTHQMRRRSVAFPSACLHQKHAGALNVDSGETKASHSAALH